MEATAVKLYSLGAKSYKTYLFATLFVAGNIILPQLFHLTDLGGRMFLPIYFFTLIAAYKYGWKVGLITAIMSPLVNSALFGMPMVAFLPVIITKSVLLALFAGLFAHHFKNVSILLLTGVVLSYQVVGTLIEWAIVGDFVMATSDFRIGVPGMLLQIFGGYLFIKHLIKN